MSDFEALPTLIWVPRIAQILGPSRTSSYRLAGSGDLAARGVGGRVYVKPSQDVARDTCHRTPYRRTL
jgi:hypothetical protein